MIYREFYSELGKLLYAVANIDGAITSEEKEKLHEIVRKELVPEETHLDNYGTDTAYYTEIEFDFLDENISDSETAFESFLGFVEMNEKAFDEKLISVCLNVTGELAAAYHRVNKKERKLIGKLKRKLENLHSAVSD